MSTCRGARKLVEFFNAALGLNGPNSRECTPAFSVSRSQLHIIALELSLVLRRLLFPSTPSSLLDGETVASKDPTTQIDHLVAIDRDG